VTYVKIWNELRMLQGQIYVLETKKRAGEITDEQLIQLKKLSDEYYHWNKISVLWDKCGSDGFDENDNPKWELWGDGGKL
jgi:hypothetical protein